MLHGNRSISHKLPIRWISGKSIAQARNTFNTNGMARNRFFSWQSAGFKSFTSLPEGYRPPFSWSMAQTNGGLASHNYVYGSGTLSNVNLAGGLNAVSALTGTGSITSASLALIVSAVATLKGYGGFAYTPTTPIRYWLFENSTAEDSITHSTLAGATITWISGKSDGAAQIPADSSITETSDDFNFITSPMTVVAIVKFTSGGTVNVAFDNGARAFELSLNASRLQVSADSFGSAPSVSDSFATANDTWTFIALRFNGTTLYGNLNNRTKISVACSTLGDSSGGDFMLETISNTAAFERVLVFNSCLSDGDIANLYERSYPNIAGILDAAAALAGSGSVTAAMTALADAVAAIAGTGTLAADASALGSMSADILPYTTLSPENMANTIMNSIVEGSMTVAEAIRILLAVAAGKTDITGSTVTFRDTTDSKDRVVANMTGSERTTVTLDGTE